MTTKHTPGPWENADGVILCEHVNAYGNFHIASVCRSEGNPRTEEDAANAHLIAAAPELLAVCNSIVRSMRNSIYVSWETLDAMDAAIAKATP